MIKQSFYVTVTPLYCFFTSKIVWKKLLNLSNYHQRLIQRILVLFKQQQRKFQTYFSQERPQHLYGTIVFCSLRRRRGCLISLNFNFNCCYHILLLQHMFSYNILNIKPCLSTDCYRVAILCAISRSFREIFLYF